VDDKHETRTAAANDESAPDWTESLARYLLREEGVEAVRLDRASGKVAIATLGRVDPEQLRQKLNLVIEAHRADLSGAALAPGRVPAGFTVKTGEDGTTVQRVSCVTAPRFWEWREFEWPEEEAARGEEHAEWKLLAWLAAVCGVLSLTAFAIERAALGPVWLAPVIFVVAMLAGGWDALKDVRENLPKGDLDIHFLMLAVAVGASLVGAFGEGALLLFLFSTSSALEDYALHRTRREINALLRAAPKQATRVLGDGSYESVAVELLEVGDRLLVRPGEQFPVDAVVISGRTAADESNLSGEARPVEKGPGDEVAGGTINLWGAVEVRVLRLASQSALQKIITLIRHAQKLRAPSERFTDRFGAGYTWFVLSACAAMFLVWWLLLDVPAFRSGGEHGFSAFYRSMTLLVVMSPCALVLSIPSAILAAIAWGARHGILFRGGAAIEKMAEVSVVALDKTGTLTTGELTVTAVESFPPGREKEVLEIAYALESRSHHPIARAIVGHGRRHGLRGEDVHAFESLTGKGVRGQVREASALLGRRELMDEGPLREWIQSVPAASPEITEVWILHDDLIGRIQLLDELRRESRGVLDELRRRSIRTVMLTGDRRHAAEAVAKQLGLDEVRAGLSPEQKVEAIRELGANGVKVAMVGDGVNDAPSLAAAYVSVAMGARGSDAALEQSEVVLVNDRIENFLAAFRLSQRSRTIIRQNLVISLGTVIIMAVAATFGAVPLTLGVFAHEGSTVVVCLNSLRLLFGGAAPAPGRP
jgi:Zn2+/Cd2+-exporting ATPase